MLCKSFLMSEEFEGPHGHCLLEKGFLHVCICIKPFFSVHNLKMHVKAHAGKGLTNAEIEEIVTNISPNPQSWRYSQKPKVKLNTRESPKWTMCWTHIVFILESGNNIKTHWKTFLLLHQCAPSWVFTIETGATINTSWGQLMASPHGDDTLAQV